VKRTEKARRRLTENRGKKHGWGKEKLFKRTEKSHTIIEEGRDTTRRIRERRAYLGCSVPSEKKKRRRRDEKEKYVQSIGGDQSGILKQTG